MGLYLDLAFLKFVDYVLYYVRYGYYKLSSIIRTTILLKPGKPNNVLSVLQQIVIWEKFSEKGGAISFHHPCFT